MKVGLAFFPVLSLGFGVLKSLISGLCYLHLGHYLPVSEIGCRMSPIREILFTETRPSPGGRQGASCTMTISNSFLTASVRGQDPVLYSRAISERERYLRRIGVVLITLDRAVVAGCWLGLWCQDLV